MALGHIMMDVNLEQATSLGLCEYDQQGDTCSNNPLNRASCRTDASLFADIMLGDTTATNPQYEREPALPCDPRPTRIVGGSSFGKMDSFRNFDLTLDINIDGHTRRKRGSAKKKKRNRKTRTAVFEEEVTEEATDSHDEEEEANLLSAEDIKDYVRQNLPLKVRERISNESWDTIFEGIKSPVDAKDVGGAPQEEGVATNASGIPIKVLEILSIEDHEDKDDTVSAVSDLTSHFESQQRPSEKAAKSKTNVSIAHEHLKTCRRLASSDRWTAFEYNKSNMKEADASCVATTSMGLALPVRPNVSRILPPPKPLRQASASTRDDFSQQEHELSPTMPQRRGTMDLHQGATASTTKKLVAFGTVQARFYDPVAELNPSVSSGVAVGIGWIYKSGNQLSVGEWEAKKCGLVRSGHELVLPRRVRERILLDAGVTQKDIAQATRTILKVKHQRKTTIENLAALQYAEDMVETAKRRIRYFFLHLSRPGARRESSATMSFTSSSSSS